MKIAYLIGKSKFAYLVKYLKYTIITIDLK